MCNRIRRIFPALIVVLVACAAFGWAMLFPDEYQSLGKHIVAGAGFASNFLLLSEVGYFDQMTEFKPLLHLWSLGIEEQFYLVWPAVILVFARWKKDPFIAAAIICISSFASNVALSATNPSAAFYLPATRFWELMPGRMLASKMFRNEIGTGSEQGPKKLFGYPIEYYSSAAECAGWLGATLIVLSMVLINTQRSFPGWWALLPTVGTVLLIGAGPTASICRLVLSNRLLVYVGLISYPLYLWHWPLLSFARIFHFKEPSTLVKLALVGAAFALAALTYRFVEKPIRYGRPTPFKPTAITLALGLVGCAGALIYFHGGLAFRYSPEVQRLITGTDAPPQFACEQDASEFGVVCLENGKQNERGIVLSGDSHAASLGIGLLEARSQTRTFNLSIHASSGCPPVISFASAQRPTCKDFNDLVMQRIKSWKPQTVLMAAQWELYEGVGGWGMLDNDAIRSTVSRLKTMGVERVVVIGQFPVWFGVPWRIRARLLRTEPLRIFAGRARTSFPDRDKVYLRPATFQADERIRKALSGTAAIFVSPLPTLCNEDGCLLALQNERLEIVSKDTEGHLTAAGSRFFISANSEAIFGR